MFILNKKEPHYKALIYKQSVSLNVLAYPAQATNKFFAIVGGKHVVIVFDTKPRVDGGWVNFWLYYFRNYFL